tara:strand:- start:503 stop:727 length:225 start_codon:yes stop_codon:yes gene_type:complete
MRFDLLKNPDGGTYLKRKTTDQMIELTENQISTLIEILQDDCESSGWSDIDYADADHMQFLAVRANLLAMLKSV